MYKDVHQFIFLVWNEEELPEEKKEFITDSFQRKEVEMDSDIIGEFKFVYFT